MANRALYDELAEVLNKHSLENGSNTPDFLLAGFMLQCLHAYNFTVVLRDRWRGNMSTNDAVSMLATDKLIVHLNRFHNEMREYLK